MNLSLSPPLFSKAETVPSFLDQTDWPCGYFDLPTERGVRWFNPSIVSLGPSVWMAVRRAFEQPPPFGQNTIVLFKLDDKKPVARVPVEFIRQYPKEHWEDPRAVVLSGQLFISFCNFRVTQNYRAHQVLARINSGRYAEDAHILYGNNALTMDANAGHEKNWVWFDHRQGWHFVYEPWPHHVVRTNRGEPCASYVSDKADCPWSHGRMRGGTPPLFHDGLYWSFFHSSVDRKKPSEPRRRYYVGAYSFEPEPPFAIHSMTLDPLLAGSELDGGILPVIFPCGAILRDQVWTVSFGVNDLASAWIGIPHRELKEQMIEL